MLVTPLPLFSLTRSAVYPEIWSGDFKKMKRLRRHRAATGQQ
jgi:hypothetical protein